MDTGHLRCMACHVPVDKTQPYYCLRCFIPVPVFDQGDYIGPEEAFCPHCQQPLDQQQREICPHCNEKMDFTTPPQPAALREDLRIREENRAKLAKEVLADNRMTQQVIEMLGIGHLPREQQGVALAALAREKLNFLSVEYNIAEAHTLADMGHAITTEIGEEWAMQLTGMRLAIVFYRKGQAMEATRILHQIYEDAPQETEVQQFRKLELLAHLALAHRLAGNGDLAAEISAQAHEQTLLMYQQMEDTIHELVAENSSISKFVGLDESGATYPRVDAIFTILVILTEEAIARGSDETGATVQPLVLNRMMELDNIIKILANISPDDDTTYFASHLRDYVRVFNGLLWYGGLLLDSDHTTRRYLIEQYFERIDQWSYMIPAQYWLPLRPARIFEIFFRAETWGKFNTSDLINRLLQRSIDQIKPRWHYVLGDAYAKVNRLDEAIEQLDMILKDKAEYMIHTDDELRMLTQQLYSTIHLESLGILVGVMDEGSKWMDLPLSIQLDEVSDYLEPESYLKDERRPPLLRMVFELPAFEKQIGIFGDKLLQAFETFPAIRKVGERDYRDVSWQSTGYAGTRTDIVVLRTELATQTLSLLFEGQAQQLVDDLLQPSPLLLLRGIIHTQTLKLQDLVEILVELLSDPEEMQQTTVLFTLKSEF